jgi:hypothetical protein
VKPRFSLTRLSVKIDTTADYRIVSGAKIWDGASWSPFLDL